MESKQVKVPYAPVNLALDLRVPQHSEQEPVAGLRLRAGDLCPTCRLEHLEYDGLLNLACPKCGYALSGCFT